MKRKIKSKLILCIIIVSLALTGIIRNELSVKYVDDSQNAKNDVISDLRDASGYWDPQITKSVGDNPYSVFIGDANNDGYNDIATANFESHDISIFLWNSTSGDWDPQITKSVGTAPTSVFIGDANNDGYHDIATANFDTNDISILLWNSTSGDWDPQITKPVGYEPLGIFIGDANNDGYHDIAASNIGFDNISILLWNSTSGDWDPQITKPVGDSPHSIFIGDANNDGYNDIAASNIGFDNISILLWNSTSGDWDPQITKSVGDGPRIVFIGDANNDGYNDIATANDYSDELSILLWNSTSGDWDPQITKSVGDGPRSVFIGDANNDGYNDIATANFDSDDISILLWNSTSGDWDPQITKPVGDGPHSIFIGDANNDGYNDITTANLISDDLSIILWKQPYILIISPENKIYGPLKEYYPATYGFDYDASGGDPAEDWEHNLSPLCSINIVDSYMGHNKVYEIFDNNEFAASDVHTNFENQSYGTMEYWTLGKSLGNWTDVYIMDRIAAQQIIRVDLTPGTYLRSWNGTGYEVYEYTEFGILNADEWYHIRVDFRSAGAASYMGLSEDSFRVYLNGVPANTELSFTSVSNSVNQFLFQSGYSAYGSEFYSYLDAVGFSWDPSYNIGDSLNEGMRLNFYNNTHLDWIAYSLDGQANIPIFDQEIIPLPADGPHTIQLFGKDTISGDIVESEIRDFIIDTTTPVININSPSPNQLCGVTAPFFDVQIIESNLHEKGYSLNGGQNITFTTETQFNQTEWDKLGNGTVLIRFYAIDELGNINFTEVVVRKDAYVPDITILSPLDDQKFGKTPPAFNLTIIEEDLASTWYAIEGIAGTFPFTGLTGSIDQDAWDDAPEGEITITFYAIDSAGNIGSESVDVLKRIPSEPVIPGFNLLFMLGIFSFVAILIRKKIKQS